MLVASSGPSIGSGTLVGKSGSREMPTFGTHPHEAQVHFLGFMVEARIVSLCLLIHFCSEEGVTFFLLGCTGWHLDPHAGPEGEGFVAGDPS